MIKIIANLVLSTPVFLLTFIVGTIILILLIISMRKYKKIPKNIMLITWLFLIMFLIIRYSDFVYNLFDNLMNNIFLQIFFPSLITYVIVFLITNVILIYSLLHKKTSTKLKIINSIFSFAIWFLSLITLELIVTKKVNVYEPLTIYTDKSLLVLVEMDMLIFVVWVLLLGSAKIISTLIKHSDKKVTKDFLNTSDDVEVLDL